ncbi:ABC transporter permease [Jiangella gansuensis]|uniref:ABC transporter permease n=1 Tax=Jiangella gansuensis TaxID=281473 RepID=UPI0009FD1174|nr:ABC transporter permease [Jiangella gansuensis]
MTDRQATTAPPKHAAAAEPAGSAPRRSLRRALVDHPLLVLGGVLVVLVLATGVIEPNYLSLRGLRNTLLLAAPLGIMAAGQTLLMLTRGIDLSVAMIATAAAYVVGAQAGGSLAVAIVLGLLVGAAAGAVNGAGVGIFQVHPLIMTLAMSTILLGVLTQLAQSVFVDATSTPDFVRTLGVGTFAGDLIPWNALIWAGLATIIIVGLRRTGFGRMLYAVGDNPVATRLAGVRTWQVLIATYALSGLFAALAGILIAGQTGAIDLQLAQELLLPSIAAAVIGGTSIFGGRGSYSGTILGALILSVLSSMLTFLDTPQAFKQVIFGLIVLGLAWLYAAVTRTRD